VPKADEGADLALKLSVFTHFPRPVTSQIGSRASPHPAGACPEER
jgi:hypothetical protein